MVIKDIYPQQKGRSEVTYKKEEFPSIRHSLQKSLNNHRQLVVSLRVKQGVYPQKTERPEVTTRRKFTAFTKVSLPRIHTVGGTLC